MLAANFHRQTGRRIFLDLLFKNRYFQIGLGFKIILAIFFASDFMTQLFAPFINQAIAGHYWSVYSDYYQVKSNAFPYPPVMLYLLSLPRYVASIFFGTTGEIGFIDIICLKIPLLFADIAISVILVKWLKNVKKVLLWYWFSPIIMYVCYVHGQLDIIPTSLLTISLHYLFKEKYKVFIIFLALACATKFHIVMTFPLILIYLYRINKLQLKSLVRGVPVFIILLVLLNMPFLLQKDFVTMVYQNQEQRKVFASFFNLFDDYRLLFIPAFYMVILYIMADFRFVNKDILIIFLALSFGIITFFLAPQPGWYMWNMPFFIYFMIRFNFRAKALFVVLNISYFLFFLTYEGSDIPQVAQLINPEFRNYPNIFNFLQSHNVNATTVVQLTFTLLQVTLLLFCVALFRLGVLQIRRYKVYYQPYLIGISGDSGSGKSTLTECIAKLFGLNNTLIVQGDDMHRWERGHEKWNELTHLNPKANWLHRDLSQLIDLKENKTIRRSHYDHDTGKFTKLIPVNPNKIIIYEGLHTFYLREASSIYDLKIFMKPSEALRRYWKIERDVKNRGYAPEKVLENIEKRVSDSDMHIANQQSEADMIFSIEALQPVTNEEYSEENLCLKIVSSNDIFFENLVDHLKAVDQLKLTHDITRHEQVVMVNGKINVVQIEEIADRLNLETKEIIGSSPVWSNNYFGVMQLFVLYHMLTQFQRTGLVSDSEHSN